MKSVPFGLMFAFCVSSAAYFPAGLVARIALVFAAVISFVIFSGSVDA